MEKRYQVFVSSTFQDLVEERREITQALLELDCIPAGMELFPAADEDQWQLIKKVIDDSDYYVVVLAGRYGSISPSGMGYTEMEYRYALSIKKPIIGFIHKNKSEIAAQYSETTEDGKSRLSNFEELVKKKPVKFWSSSSELGSVVSRSLIHLIKTSPSIGWIKADQARDEKSLAKIVELQGQLALIKSQKEKFVELQGATDLVQGSDKMPLMCEIEYFNKIERATELWTWRAEPTFNAIFRAVSPSLSDGVTDENLKDRVNTFLENNEFASIKRSKQYKDMEYKGLVIEDDDFETIKVQFAALGLVSKHKLTSSTDLLFRLTPAGERLMMQVRAVKRPIEKASAGQVTAKISEKG